MKTILLASTLLLLAPSLTIAQARVITVHNGPTIHDRSPRIHDRAPRIHNNHLIARS